MKEEHDTTNIYPSIHPPEKVGKVKRPEGAPKGNSNAAKHRHYVRKVKLTDVALVDISRQNGAGAEIWRKAEAIFADGGGREHFSELRQHMVQRYLITEHLIDHLDVWLLARPSLILKRRKCVMPILMERNRIVETSLRLAESIGLEKQPPPVPSLSDYVARKAALPSRPARPTPSAINGSANAQAQTSRVAINDVLPFEVVESKVVEGGSSLKGGRPTTQTLEQKVVYGGGSGEEIGESERVCGNWRCVFCGRIVEGERPKSCAHCRTSRFKAESV